MVPSEPPLLQVGKLMGQGLQQGAGAEADMMSASAVCLAASSWVRHRLVIFEG